VLSQANIDANTPMGATLIAGGATFRAWAPRASAVYLNGTFGGVLQSGTSGALLMAEDGHGYWTGFLADVADGDLYRFWVIGAEPANAGYKRDPYARELANDQPFPMCNL